MIGLASIADKALFARLGWGMPQPNRAKGRQLSPNDKMWLLAA